MHSPAGGPNPSDLRHKVANRRPSPGAFPNLPPPCYLWQPASFVGACPAPGEACLLAGEVLGGVFLSCGRRNALDFLSTTYHSKPLQGSR
jgi:hypothetical protein